MSKFKNISNGILTLANPIGSFFVLDRDEEFNGSNYYKRFTMGTIPALELIEDDGTPYIDGDSSSNAILREVVVTIDPASTWGDNEIDVYEVLGGPAYQVTLDTNENIRARFNGDVNGSFSINNATYNTSRGDILIGKIEFDSSFSGSSGGTVTVKMIGIPDSL